MNPQEILDTARYALNEARRAGVNDPAIMFIDSTNPIVLKNARAIAPIPECADALVSTWARKADAVNLVEQIVPGSDTVKIAAEQLKHDEPYLLQLLGNKIVISSWDSADEPLAHITMNTGHSASIPRAFVTQETLDILGPLVRAGGGRVPNMPFEFSIVEHDGAATLDIRYIRDGHVVPVIVGTVCEKRSDEWGKHLLRTASGAGVDREIAKPSSTPWLGIVIIPSLALDIMPPDEAQYL